VNPDARYLATLLTAVALACALAVSLWQDAPRVSGADVVRDAVLLRAR
jgi:hypothetical protein